MFKFSQIIKDMQAGENCFFGEFIALMAESVIHTAAIARFVGIGTVDFIVGGKTEKGVL